MADLPRYGRGMCEEITISPERPAVSGLHLFVNREGKVSMRYQNGDQYSTQVQVYPNPVEALVTVNSLSSNATYNVVVLNSSGMIVLSENQLRSNLLGELTISVDDLSSGLYFIQVKGTQGTMMAKFVKR